MAPTSRSPRSSEVERARRALHPEHVQPIIGVSGDIKLDPAPVVRVKLAYLDAVRRAGGIPMILPAAPRGEIERLLERVDGVLLTGGDDIDVRERGRDLHPSAELMDPRRQAAEMALAQAVLERRTPALGVCLGMQVLAYAAGGELHQHLPDAGYRNLLDHRVPHAVEVMPGSRLASILANPRPEVVSHHHQAVARSPASLRQVARASDGVIEALEATDGRFLVAVQWHPERSPDAPESQRLFRALVDAARGQ
jgi:putative glutamine amidotransferase